MNLYNIYFVSKGTGPRTVQVEALNQAGTKAQVEARYPGAYNIIPNQLPSSSKKNEISYPSGFHIGIGFEGRNGMASARVNIQKQGSIFVR